MSKHRRSTLLNILIILGTLGIVLYLGSRDNGLAKAFAAIRSAVDVPIAAGFGISTKEQAATVGEVADGFVVGSALVKALGKDGKIHAEDLRYF